MLHPFPSLRFRRGILLLGSVLAGMTIAAATTIEVAPGGPSIGDAIASAADGDTVLIHPGTYYEADLSFSGKDLVLRSTAPDDSAVVAATVIDASDEYRKGVFRLDSGQSLATEILGLTLQGGSGTVTAIGGWGAASTAGGAIYAPDEASPRIAHCVFRDNYVLGSSGTGAALYLGHSVARVEECRFEHNTGPGAVSSSDLAISYGTPEIRDCSFIDCQGGALYASSSSVAAGGCYVNDAAWGIKVSGGRFDSRADFSDWTIEHTTSQGIDMRFGARADFRDCVVRDCSSRLDAGGVVIAGATATFSGCRFEANSSTGYWGAGGGGMTLTDANVTLDGCTFIGNYSHWTGAGLYAENSSFLMTECLFRDNWSEVQGGAIALFEGGAPTIERCTLVNNSALSGGGIYVGAGCGLTLSSSIVYGNAPEAVVDVDGGADISYSDIEGGWSGSGNIDADPLFCNPGCADRDYSLAAISPCAHSGQGGVDMGAAPVTCDEPVIHDPRTIQVPGDAPTLEAAMAIACEGDIIQLAPQTHTLAAPLQNRGRAFTIRSTDPGRADVVAATIVSGAGDHDLFHLTPVVGRATVIDGITLQNGRSAIVCDGGSASIRHCRIHDNDAAGGNGGGIRCEHGTAPTIEDCSIFDNSAKYGGGVYSHLSTVTLLRCDIRNNHCTQDGGGIYVGDGPLLITASTIDENRADHSGGGISCRDRSTPTLRNCSIANNSAGNSGGGVEALESLAPALDFCTIINNSAGGPYGGGGIYCNGLPGYPEFSNMILWGNTPDQANGLIPTFNYSDVQGGAGGSGNIDLDPQLGFYLQHYRLPAPGSPCIDSGDPALTDAIYDAHPRWPHNWPNGARADMGAFGGPDNNDWVPR